MAACFTALTTSATVILDTKFVGNTTQVNASKITVAADAMHADFGTTIDLNRGSALPEFVPFVNVNVAGSPTTIGSNSSMSSGTENTLATAIASSHFIEFTLASSTAYNIDSITLTMAGDGSNSSGFHGYLLSNATGFSAGDSLGVVDGLYNGTIFNNTIDVSSIVALDNRTSTKFRLYLVENHNGDQANREFGIESIAVNGTVVPEPATLGLVTAFGAAVLFIRRRFMI